jgi:hypothetical protein
MMNSRKLRLPEILEKLWRPLLNILHKLKLTSSFVQLMVSMVTEKENFQNFWLCSWLQRIITSNAKSLDHEESEYNMILTSIVNYKEIA